MNAPERPAFMLRPATPASQTLSCSLCPLRALPLFQRAEPEELALIDRLKHSELEVDADTVLLQEGQTGAALYTLLEGWAYRYNMLPDGRRQILAVLMPGDFIGLQKRLTEAATYGVRTLTAARLCAFQRDALWQLHRELPSLGYDLTWLAAQGEQVVDENLLTVGRRNARERVAALLLGLHERALHHQSPAADGSVQFPLTQQHLADALGLSRVHVQRTLRTLDREGLAVFTVPGRLLLPHRSKLARVAGLPWPLTLPMRPLI
jgi:CRP/FNR family transcriptional regulator, anaerobic regulatory protein